MCCPQTTKKHSHSVFVVHISCISFESERHIHNSQCKASHIQLHNFYLAPLAIFLRNIWSMLMHYKRESDKPFNDNDSEWNSIFINNENGVCKNWVWCGWKVFDRQDALNCLVSFSVLLLFLCFYVSLLLLWISPSLSIRATSLCHWYLRNGHYQYRAHVPRFAGSQCISTHKRTRAKHITPFQSS